MLSVIELRKLVYLVSRARMLLAYKEYKEAGQLLDEAAAMLPERFWPHEKSLQPPVTKGDRL